MGRSLRPYMHNLLLSSAAACRSLEGVQNFRPVRSLPGLFRSASLEQATASDAAFLLDSARVRTIVDLRNDDEIARARATATPVGLSLLAAFDSGAAVGASCIASEGGGVLRRFQVPLLGDVDGLLDEVAARLPTAKRMEAALYRTVDMRRHDRLVYDALSQGKQQLLYTSMIASAPPAVWQQALSIAADRRSGNVLIHCARGKDRTGVLAALLQHAVGDAPEKIVEEYALSEVLLGEGGGGGGGGGGGAAAQQSVLQSSSRQQQHSAGVDWSALRGSPPAAMEDTLGWVRSKYGAIDSFLEKVGCGEAWRQSLLAEPALASRGYARRVTAGEKSVVAS